MNEQKPQVSIAVRGRDELYRLLRLMIDDSADRLNWESLLLRTIFTPELGKEDDMAEPFSERSVPIFTSEIQADPLFDQFEWLLRGGFSITASQSEIIELTTIFRYHDSAVLTGEHEEVADRAGKVLAYLQDQNLPFALNQINNHAGEVQIEVKHDQGTRGTITFGWGSGTTDKVRNPLIADGDERETLHMEFLMPTQEEDFHPALELLQALICQTITSIYSLLELKASEEMHFIIDYASDN